MKPFRVPFLAAALLLLFCLPMRAQLGEREIQFKPFSLSFSTRSGWDGGGGTPVFTERLEGERETLKSSFYAGFDASGAVNFVWPDTFLGSRMTMRYTYYFQRDSENDSETSINIDSTFSHVFSPRWTLTVNNRFFQDTEEQIGTDSFFPNGAQQFRREGDYYTDDLNINNNFLLGPQLTMGVGLSYGLVRYANPASANVLDRDEYGINLGFTYALTSATSVGISFGYNRSEHPGPTKIFSTITNGVLVALVERSFDTESVSFTFNHAFSSRFRVGGFVGLTITSFEDGTIKGKSLNPAVSVSANYQFDPKTTLSASYTHAISEAEIRQFTAAIQDTATVRLSHQLTPKIPISMRASYSQSSLDQEFNAATAASTRASATDEAYTLSISSGYSFTRFLSLNLGYSYTTVRSDFSGGSFTRDRASFDVRFSF